MRKRILSLLLAFLMLFSMFPSYTTYAVETENEVTVSYFNSASEAMEEADTVELYRGGEQIVSATLRSDISGSVQWQIEAEQDLWVDIQGGTAEDLRVSYGMVKSLLSNDSVRMRCAVYGNENYYSDPFVIVVTDVDNRISADTFNMERTPIAPDPLAAPVGVPNETEPEATEETDPAATEETEPVVTEETEPVTAEETEPVVTEETVSIVDNAVPLASSAAPRIMLLSAVNTINTDAENEDVTYYTVTIEYVYGDSSKFAGQRVALPYIAEVASGDTLNETVASPSCVGYTPNIVSINLAEHGEINSNVSLTVVYSPAEVSYTVRHYQQNVNNDEYTWVDTTLATGYTEALTNDNAAKTYTGFTALTHYHEEIAADSSTTIDIYYDRNYYLMSFDLDGGYGVNPIYARYEAPISVGTPLKSGYVFAGWENATIPKKMPSENRSYKALWTPQEGIGYRVTYWILNEDNSKVLLGSHIEYGEAGSQVSGTNNLGTNEGTICGEELSHVHAAGCYDCNLLAHSHTSECFTGYTLGQHDPGENGIAAINDAGGEEGYIYVIYNPASGTYWPKLYLNGAYYVVNGTQGGTTQDSYSAIVTGNPIVTKTGTYGTETLTVYKYQAKTTCGNLQHAHTSCTQTCTEHTHTDECYVNTRHMEFVEADQNVTIDGDGTSVVNVYYKYKEYTLRFYYAASTGTGENVTYKIVGGSTYYFGRQNGTDSAEDTDVLKNMWNASGQWGAVDELPTLNDRGIAKNYTTGSVAYNHNNTDVTYYYIEFKARFGDNISEKWPCGVFNSVTRTDKNNANGWSGTEAFVSAWNGEHHVKYSQDNGNETIKGVYEKLDENLLFATKYEDETTVSYLCFWENGANIGWSKPELYRYNIYLSAYSGQKFDADTPTIVRDGVTYYLYDSYDTCDNSSIGEQTQVSLVGYEAVTFKNALDGYTIGGSGFEYRQLTGTADETLLGQDGYFDNGLYMEGYEINFYYNAHTYKLSFWNHDDYLTSGTGSQVAYNEPLKKYIEGITVGDTEYDGASDIVIKPEKYPKSLEANVYEFEGWYTSAGFEPETKVDPNTATMPNEALMLYAHWVPIIRTVKIQLTEGGSDIATDIAVPHGTMVPAENHPDTSTLKLPTDETATFIGWFYKDENGVEQAFDFANMIISQNMTIYAKWRSNVMKQVEIYYETDDGTQVADTETLMLRLGQTRTFDAKTGNSLYEDYRTSCFPTTATHSITITDEHIGNDTPVSYTFVYKKCDSVPYQVEFYMVEQDGTERPAFRVDDSGNPVFVEYGQWQTGYTGYVEAHWQNYKAVVMELYEPDALANTGWLLPEAYLPNALRIQKIIIPSETNPTGDIAANTIKFVYTYMEPEIDTDDPDNPDPGNPVYQARYLVQHYVQNVSDPNAYDLYKYSDEVGLSGQTVSASPISIPGYTYSATITDANKGNNTFADNVLSGTITADDSLELNFYYTVNSYPYQVMYLEQDTNRVLAATRTMDSEGNLLKGQYGAKVTESAIPIDGYDIVGSSTKSIYIQMEAGDTANVNTIVFYYKLKSAELVISKTVELDATQAAQEGISEIPSWVYDQEFEFTVYQSEGYPKSVYYYTFTDANNNSEERTVNAGVQTIVVSLKHGESVQFHDFPMGTYTVTETYVPGFRTSMDGYIAQAHTVTLDADGEVGTLNFLNTFPFYTGDLVIKKNVTKGESDPTATEPYKVTVVLNPEDSAREVDRVITFVDKDGNALTDANNNSSFTIPKLTGTNDQTQFTITLLVPVGGEVKMEGVPVGSFTAEEEVKGTIGYIYDFYTVKYNKAVHEYDEVTGTNHVVSGSIHGGHPTAVTFNNTYKKGNLTINKTVTQEYEKDNWQSDTFTFSITGTTELPDGIYVVDGAIVTVSDGVVTVKDSNGNDPAISITKTDGATSWSGSLTFENLPAGYYTVTETAGLGNDKYTAVGPEDSLLVNDTAAAAEANFTNTYKRITGNLQVGKEIVIVTDGSIIDTEQEFTFVVEPKDGTLTGTYAYTIKATSGTSDISDDTVVKSDTLPVTDGKLTFNLKHNQYILIEGLPVGDYLVKEEAIEGYDSSFGDVITNAGNYSVDPATITTNNTTVLNCQNAYPVYYSNLIVKKTVVTPADHSAVDQAPADDEFTFTVTISGYSNKVDLTKGVTAKFYDSTDTLIKTEAILLNADSLTFTLKAGEWVDLNLPACIYTIAETGLSSTVNSDVLADHYATSYAVGGEVGVTGESYTLVSGEQETVVFTNTYKRHYLDLTITTTCADYNQSFIFDVSATGTALGDIHLTVVLVGNDSQTIKDLPVGEYTVTEQTKWSWREADVESQTVILQTQSVTVPFDFGVIDRIYWLSGYSYNYRKKGGS